VKLPAIPSTLILNIGQDRALLDSRGLVLQSAGYTVESICSIEQAIDRFKAGVFHLVVLCHSLSEKERERLIRHIRVDGPATPVIFTAAIYAACPDHLADRSIGSAPDELLRSVHDVLQEHTVLCKA
jgi:DNA-binding response OmpR family regulator